MAQDLLREPTARVLRKMSIPISIGMLSTILFQVVDTYFVGTLGAVPLAALGFASTLYFLLIGLDIGLSIAFSVLVGKAFGEQNLSLVRRTATLGLLLSFLVGSFFSLLGLLFMESLFGFLGATAEIIPHIEAYMTTVFYGLPLLSVGLVASGVLRASGVVRFPEVIFGIAGVINLVLDYAFIFGEFGFPQLGIKGVAYGTALSWAFILICMLIKLGTNEYLVSIWSGFQENILIVKSTFSMGTPIIITQLVGPFTLMFVTFLLGRFSADAVAAFGVAGRIETLVMIGIMSVGTASTPFIAQNLGASQTVRIDQAIAFGGKAANYLGVLFMILLFLFIKPIAGLFSDQATIVGYTAYYFYFVAGSYAFYGLYLITASILNGLQRTMEAMKIMLVKTLVFTIPLCLIGALFSVHGIFIGLGLSHLIGGLYAGYEMHKELRRVNSSLVGVSPIKDMLGDLQGLFGTKKG